MLYTLILFNTKLCAQHTIVVLFTVWLAYFFFLHADIINPTNLLKICSGKLSTLTTEDIKMLSKKLTVFDEYCAWDGSPSEVLFHVLYNWHCKKPKATKKDLALMVRECHPRLYNHAIDLDPNCEFI
jgi:hypothetical protein